MSHRKQQKEALRREREERERRALEAKQRKRMVGYGAAGALVVVAIVVAVVALGGGGGGDGDEAAAQVLPDGGSIPEQRMFDVAPAAREAGCELRSERAPSRQHTTSLDQTVNYDSNPPDSGRHYEIPAEDGAYGEAPPDEALVHSLEHGRVLIWFKPGLPEDQRADLKALFDEDTYQMLLIPRANMPYAVAASAWNRDPTPNGTGRLLLCERIDPAVFDALRAFRDEHRSNGPEPVP